MTVSRDGVETSALAHGFLLWRKRRTDGTDGHLYRLVSRAKKYPVEVDGTTAPQELDAIARWLGALGEPIPLPNLGWVSKKDQRLHDHYQRQE